MTRFIVKNKHQDTRYDKIGLHSLDIDIILGPIDDIVGTRESLCGQLKRMEDFFHFDPLR